MCPSHKNTKYSVNKQYTVESTLASWKIRTKASWLKPRKDVTYVVYLGSGRISVWRKNWEHTCTVWKWIEPDQTTQLQGASIKPKQWQHLTDENFAKFECLFTIRKLNSCTYVCILEPKSEFKKPSSWTATWNALFLPSFISSKDSLGVCLEHCDFIGHLDLSNWLEQRNFFPLW